MFDHHYCFLSMLILSFLSLPFLSMLFPTIPFLPLLSLMKHYPQIFFVVVCFGSVSELADLEQRPSQSPQPLEDIFT